MGEVSDKANDLPPLPSDSEQDLNESEARYKLLVESVKDYAIFMLNTEGRIATWNEGAQRIKGYEAADIIGSHFSIFYTQESVLAKFPEFELAQAIEKGRFEDEGWRIRKDGSRFWANVVITTLYNSDGHHIGFAKVTRDLSERVRNEALMEKNRSLQQLNTDLDNFVYTASHDLKSPVLNLEGLLSIMKSRISPKLDESDRQIVEMMGASVLKLKKTISGLTEVTKAQKNLENLLELINVEMLAGEVKEELAAAIAGTGTSITESYNVKELLFTRAGLRSILYNLVSNAIKYSSPARKPVINISTFREKGKVVLCIRDNGLGLSPKQQVKLFGMFKRFHNHVEGTGIGLYIVKRTLENHGGRVKVESRLNEGTEFKLYFKA